MAVFFVRLWHRTIKIACVDVEDADDVEDEVVGPPPADASPPTTPVAAIVMGPEAGSVPTHKGGRSPFK